MTDAPLSAAVVVATYRRPALLRTCLEHLSNQTVAPVSVVVVDGSPDHDSEPIARAAGAVYLRNPLGAGHTATSRTLGVAVAGDVDILAFVDDDAFAEPDWLEEILRPYADPQVVGVGGRAANGQPGEEQEGLDEIGRFRADGTLTGFFAARPSTDVDVDHLLGANMSFRRSALEAIGGIEDHYPGTCLREETDPALRLRRAGGRLVFAPAAEVVHVAGEYAKGERFDTRYVFYTQRNHLVLLARVVGVGDPVFRRYLGVARRAIAHSLRSSVTSLGRRRLLGPSSITTGVVRGLVDAAAASAGVAAGLWVALTGQVPRPTPGPAART